MKNIAVITIKKRGKKSVNFNQKEIYGLLREKLGFRYVRINTNECFLRFDDGTYQYESFHSLKDFFHGYIKTNFDLDAFNIPIDYTEFMKEYFTHLPLKNCTALKHHLSKDFELPEPDKHQIKLKFDFKYRIQFEENEMLQFLKEEGFIETKDKALNFFNRECPLFYKKIEPETYLVFTECLMDRKELPTIFDFLKFDVKSEKEFLVKKHPHYKCIINGFNLKRDLDLYLAEVFKATAKPKTD